MESSSVLLVTDQYASSEDDGSNINREVAQTLTGAGRKVYGIVLEYKEEDRKCAEADGVELILPTSSQEDTRKPCLDWLTFDHSTRYPRLPQDAGWIVGHAGVTSRAAVTIKDQRFPQANLCLVTRTIPEDTEKYMTEEKAMGIGRKEDSIRQDAEKADNVFSVGHRTHDHFTNSFRAIHEDIRPTHYLFLPEPPELFQKTTVEYKETKEKSVLIIGRVNTVERVKGFDLATQALSKVVKRSQNRIKLRIRGVSEEEYQASMNILQASINSGKLIPTLLPHGTQEDICRDMKQAHLVLMPSRTEPFGMVGLEAMAVGVPVLISDQSGLATLVDEVIPEFHHSVLGITGDDSVDVRRWADQIENVLRKSKAEFSRAAALKKNLLESRYWEESHQHFLQACGGAGLAMDLQLAESSEKKEPYEEHGMADNRDHTGKESETEMDLTGTPDKERTILYENPNLAGGPPLLPVMVEMLDQVEQTVEDPDDFLNYASAKRALHRHTINVSATEIRILNRIKPKTINVTDLQKVVTAMETFQGIGVARVESGSLVFYLKCADLSGLGELWFTYKNGKLNNLLHSSLIGEETVQQLSAGSISVKTTINIDDFRTALIYLLTSPAAKGLDRTISIDNLMALPNPAGHLGSSNLRGLDLDMVSRESCTGMVVSTLKFTTRQVQTALQTSKVKSQQQLKDSQQRAEQLEVELQTMREQLHTAREHTEAMVHSLTREVTRLTEKDEKAQKILLEQKAEIKQLQETDKTRKNRIEELTNENTKMSHLHDEIQSLREKEETLQKTLLENELEIQQLQETNKEMADRIKNLQSVKKTLEDKSQGENSEGKKDSMEGQSGLEETTQSGKASKDDNKESSSVLLVSDQYASSEDDSSNINREVAQTLTGAGRKVYSLVLENTEEDRKCAEADGVELILPTSSQEDTRKPCLDWLTFDHLNRYPRLPQDIGWIVGHTGVTSKAAVTIMEERFPQANLSLVTQTIPEDTEKYKDEEKAMGIGKKEESIRQDAEKADNVFSVGHRIHDHFINIIRAISKEKRPVHKLFLPEPSKKFQGTTVEYVEGREKIVLLFSKVTEVGKLKGLDFAAKALARVVEGSRERIKLRIRGVSKEEYQASMKILQAYINSGKLIPTLLPHGTQEDICRDMQQAHLVLMPSQTEPFGLIGLEAMAAGVPVLISDQSGLATLVNKVIPEFHHSVLGITGDDSVDVRHWSDQIEKVLRMSEAEFKRAAALKKKLLESRYWEESHQGFLQAFKS